MILGLPIIQIKQIIWGKYKYWQICDTGRVDGINGNVDIDIMYE